MTGGDAQLRQRLRAWILDAMASPGGAATQLDVARHVWTHRRDELEESGDLLYVWQLELGAVADEMVAEGVLATAADGWIVANDAARAHADRPTGWTDDEIAAVVTAYVSLVRDRDEGRPARHREAVADLRDRTGRTRMAIEALFANVSAVVQEQGVEFLAAYPPRSNVPRGVRPVVLEALTR